MTNFTEKEQALKRLNTTPTFNRLSRMKLQVGENIETVNHAKFADMDIILQVSATIFLLVLYYLFLMMITYQK